MSANPEAFDASALGSTHTEITVLGAMLLDANAIQDATENLQVGDFTLDSHRKIYRAILAVMQDAIGVDYVTVMNELERKKQLSSIGGPAYLAFLTEGIPRNPKIEDYVRIIKDKSLLRQTVATCQVGVDRAVDGSDDPRTIISETVAGLNAVLEEAHEEVSLEHQAIKELEILRRQRLGEQKVFVTSGLEDIDFTHGGFAKGEMTVIAARPGVGKSSLGRQAIRANCLEGKHCHLVTPEMKAGQVLRLYASIEAKIPFVKLRHPERLSEADMEEIESAMQDVMMWPLTIDDQSPIMPAEAISRARSVHRKEKTELFIVDYLQKFKYPGKPEHRHIQVADAMVGLTSMAKNTGMAVVAISSLTEPSGKERNRVPTKADLRQSGDIQYEANAIIILHREIDETTRKAVPLCQLIFDKVRSDEEGVREIYFDSEYIRFIGKQMFLDKLGA